MEEGVIMPELRFMAVRGQLGVIREGYPSVWFDCPAVDAFETAQYICRKHDAKMVEFTGAFGYIPVSVKEKAGTAIPA